MNRKLFLVSGACTLAVAACAFVAACGSSTPSTSPSGFTITISSFSFSPLNLNAPPGATVTVVNDDNTPHSVTSETAPETFTPGAVRGVSFDTGPFTGQASFTLPSSAPNGTVIPYYCSVHKSAMTTRTGTITIQVTAAPDGGAPDGGVPDAGAPDGGAMPDAGSMPY
jgi:plastocyanin